MRSSVWKFVSTMMGSPFVWGAVFWGVWYGVLLHGPIPFPELRALFVEHPLEYVSAALFFVGLASLGLRGVGLAREGKILRQVESQQEAKHHPAGFLDWRSPEDLGRSLAGLPRRLRDSLVVSRFLEILRHWEQKRSAEELQEYIRYLSDKAASNAAVSYALVRMFIWAIPILGFLGTVVGIALALGNLAPQQLEESLPEVMAGLTVAFNTTIQALGLCIVLYFALFFVERAEGRLLERLDSAADQVVGVWAKQLGQQGELLSGGEGRALRDAVVEAFRAPVAAWDNLARQLITSLGEIGSRMAHEIHRGVTLALERSFAAHVEKLSVLEHQILAEHRQRVEELQDYFQQRVERLVQLQESVEERTELLLKAVEATQVLRTLQESLNRNLTTLAASQQFQELLMSLTAAIHLLTARVENSLGELGSREAPSLGMPAIRKAS